MDAEPRQGFQVARWVDVLGGFVARRPALWIGLGNLETRPTRRSLGSTSGPELIRFPSYYRPGFTNEQLESIERLTMATADRYGYAPATTVHDGLRLPRSASR